MDTATFLDSVRHFVASPVPWIMFSVVNFLGAVFLGEIVPKRWREMAIWIPVGLIALLAVRPYPGPKEMPSKAHTEIALTTASYVADAVYVQDGLYHHRYCERLRTDLAQPITERAARLDHIGACPDCINYTGE